MLRNDYKLLNQALAVQNEENLADFASALRSKIGKNLYVLLLFFAIEDENKAVFEFLVKAAPIPEYKFYKNYDHSVIGLALKLGKHKILSLLLKNIDPNFALYVATKAARSKILHFLQDKCIFNRRMERLL